LARDSTLLQVDEYLGIVEGIVHFHRDDDAHEVLHSRLPYASLLKR